MYVWSFATRDSPNPQRWRETLLRCRPGISSNTWYMEGAPSCSVHQKTCIAPRASPATDRLHTGGHWPVPEVGAPRCAPSSAADRPAWWDGENQQQQGMGFSRAGLGTGTAKSTSTTTIHSNGISTLDAVCAPDLVRVLVLYRPGEQGTAGGAPARPCP